MAVNTYSKKRIQAIFNMVTTLPGAASRTNEVGEMRSYLKSILDTQADEIEMPIEQVHALREFMADVI